MGLPVGFLDVGVFVLIDHMEDKQKIMPLTWQNTRYKIMTN